MTCNSLTIVSICTEVPNTAWLQTVYTSLDIWSLEAGVDVSWIVVANCEEDIFPPSNNQSASSLTLKSFQLNSSAYLIDLVRCLIDSDSKNTFFLAAPFIPSTELLDSLVYQPLPEKSSVAFKARAVFSAKDKNRCFTDQQLWLKENSFELSEIKALNGVSGSDTSAVIADIGQLSSYNFAVASSVAQSLLQLLSLEGDSVAGLLQHLNNEAFNQIESAAPIFLSLDYLSSNDRKASNWTAPSYSPAVAIDSEGSHWLACVLEVLKPSLIVAVGRSCGHDLSVCHSELFSYVDKSAADSFNDQLESLTGLVVLIVSPDDSHDLVLASKLKAQVESKASLSLAIVINNCIHSFRQVVPQALGDVIESRLFKYVDPFVPKTIEVSHVQPQGTIISYEGVEQLVNNGNQQLAVVDVSSDGGAVVLTNDQLLAENYCSPTSSAVHKRNKSRDSSKVDKSIVGEYFFGASIIDAPPEASIARSFTFKVSPLKPFIDNIQVSNDQQLLNLINKAIEYFDSGNIQDSYLILKDNQQLLESFEAYNYALAVCEYHLCDYTKAEVSLKVELDRSGYFPALVALNRIVQEKLYPHGVNFGNERKGSLITLVTCPRAFKGQVAESQRNAITSWQKLEGVNIVLCGSEYGVKEMAEEIGCFYFPAIDTNELGTPLIDSVFTVADQISNTPLISFISSDIILFDDFVSTAKLCEKEFKEFVLAGRRWNLDISGELEFDQPLEIKKKLLAECSSTGMMSSSITADYFVYRASFFKNVPSYAIGRASSEKWLLSNTRNKGIPLIDGSNAIFAVHHNHGYGQHSNQFHGSWVVRHGIEVERNQTLVKEDLDFGDLRFATHEVVEDAVKLKMAQAPCPFLGQLTKTRMLSQKSLMSIQQGQLDVALDYFEQIRQSGSFAFGYHATKAMVQYHLGRHSEARTSLEAELEYYPSNINASASLDAWFPDHNYRSPYSAFYKNMASWQSHLLIKTFTSFKNLTKIVFIGADLYSLHLLTNLNSPEFDCTFVYRNESEVLKAAELISDMRLQSSVTAVSELEFNQTLDDQTIFDIIIVGENLEIPICNKVFNCLNSEGLIVNGLGSVNLEFSWDYDCYSMSIKNFSVLDSNHNTTSFDLATPSMNVYDVCRNMIVDFTRSSKDRYRFLLKPFANLTYKDFQDLIEEDRISLLPGYV